jgi:hypothetical protein
MDTFRVNETEESAAHVYAETSEELEHLARVRGTNGVNK